MGVILLGGIVVNNSIILVDEINRLRLKGIRINRAVFLAALSRIRPIAMTACTTIIGLFPLALSKTEESNLWSPMALVVIGGLSCATILTPVSVPGVYLILEDLKTVLSSLIRFRVPSPAPKTVS